MGDVAMTAPVVESLRISSPDIRISVLTRPFFRTFYRDIEGLEFIDFQPDKRHKGFMGLVRLARDIRATGADSVADLHDVLRTKVVRRLLWLSGMRVAKIDKGRYERYGLTKRSGKILSQITPMIERYRRTILRLGIRFNMVEPPAHSPRPMPGSLVVGSKRGVWVGVAPFAKHKGKIYPIPLADKLIGMLAEKYSKVFIFGGGDHEKSFAEGMEQRHLGVISVVGKIGLSDEMDVISNLDAIVTMDSASMHMASLVGTPAVSIWGATHPYAGFYGWGQNPEDAVQLDLPCRPCSIYGNKPCIFGDYRCLADISPEMVMAAVERRVKEERKKTRETTGRVKSDNKPGEKEEGVMTARERAAAVREAARKAESERQAGKTVTWEKIEADLEGASKEKKKPASKENSAETKGTSTKATSPKAGTTVTKTARKKTPATKVGDSTGEAEGKVKAAKKAGKPAPKAVADKPAARSVKKSTDK